jgi:hypothetical protein
MTTTKSYLTLLAIGSLYIFAAAAALMWGIQAYTPCVSNFEGGCGMAKGMLALASLLPAALAAGLAFPVKGALAAIEPIAAYATPVGFILGAVPAAYILYALKSIFIG